MKTKLTSLVLACVLIFSVLPLTAPNRAYARPASMVALTISGTTVNGWAYGSTQVVTLRFFADQDFSTATGEIIKAGNSRSGTGFYRSYTCTVVGTVLNIPTITDIPTTTDSPDLPDARWTARFFQGNTPREYWIAGFNIRHTYVSPQTWATIWNYNNPPGVQVPPSAINGDQAALLISQSLGSLNFANVARAGVIETTVAPADSSRPKAVEDGDPRVAAASTTNRGTVTTSTSSSQVVSKNDYATTTNTGISKASVAPASASAPIFVGDNDQRVPTQAENDALVGTSGTPSSVNKYVTDADPRVPTQAENDALVGTGTPSSSNPYVSNDDRRVGGPFNIKGSPYNAVCDGTTADTVAIAAANTAAAAVGGSLYIPPSTGGCVIGTATITAKVVSDGGFFKLTTGQTTVFTNAITAPPGLLFANATTGLGTVSFAANKLVTEVWSEWWGGGVGVAATPNTAAWNALNAALVTMAQGTIRAATGQYDFNGLVTIGTDADFTNINIRGEGLYTLFNWTGSTSGTMFRVTKGRNNRFDDFRLGSSVAKGTSIGIILTGPAVSLQTSGCTWTNVSVRGFAKGVSLGEGSTAVGEQQFNNCNFSENATGVFMSGNGNTLVITFVNTSFGNNTLCGINIGDGVASTHIVGGAFAANGVAGNNATGDILLALGWNSTVHLQNIRFEIGNGTTDAFRGGVINLQGSGTVILDNCQINSIAVPTSVPFIMGLANWTINGLTAFGDGAEGFILANVDGNGGGSVTVNNSRIQNSNTRTVPGGGVNTTMLGIQFNPDNGGSWGMKIKGENNYSSFGKFDDIDAILGATPAATGKVYASRRISPLGQVSADTYDWADQDATPSTAWANEFSAADTSAVTQTNMDDGASKQTVTIYFTNGNRTIQDNANQQLSGGVDFVGTANDVLVMTKVGSVWIERSRSVN